MPNPTVIQSTGNAGLTSSAGPFTQAFASNNTLGNTLVAIGWMNGVSSNTPSVTDTKGNTWTLIKSAVSANGSQLSSFIAVNCKAGANTVSLTSNGTPTAGNLFCIAEINGANTIDQLAFAAGSLGNGATIVTPSITTLQANSIVISCTQTGNAATSSVSQTQLGQVAGSSSYGNAQYETESSTGTFNGTFTTTGTTASGITFNLYNVSSGGGGGSGLWLAMDASVRNSGLRH